MQPLDKIVKECIDAAAKLGKDAAAICKGAAAGLVLTPFVAATSIRTVSDLNNDKNGDTGLKVGGWLVASTCVMPLAVLIAPPYWVSEHPSYLWAAAGTNALSGVYETVRYYRLKAAEHLP